MPDECRSSVLQGDGGDAVGDAYPLAPPGHSPWLAVTMLAILQHPERAYVPLSEEGKKGFERYRAELEYLAMQKASRKGKKVA